MASRETAVRYMASQIAPLIEAPVTSTQFWAKGFYESYRTELRPESSEGRAAEIVERYGKRYEKPMTAIRVINSAATFEGGLDYVLRKLKNHSGVTIEPTSFQRKHPVICSPVLGWKLWRKGAFN